MTDKDLDALGRKNPGNFTTRATLRSPSGNYVDTLTTHEPDAGMLVNLLLCGPKLSKRGLELARELTAEIRGPAKPTKRSRKAMQS
jgi:hypothetical protein